MPDLVTCPACEGDGRIGDPIIEYDECALCKGVGKVTPEAAAAYREDVAQIDAEIDKWVAEQREAGDPDFQ